MAAAIRRVRLLPGLAGLSPTRQIAPSGELRLRRSQHHPRRGAPRRQAGDEDHGRRAAAGAPSCGKMPSSGSGSSKPGVGPSGCRRRPAPPRPDGRRRTRRSPPWAPATGGSGAPAPGGAQHLAPRGGRPATRPRRRRRRGRRPPGARPARSSMRRSPRASARCPVPQPAGDAVGSKALPQARTRARARAAARARGRLRSPAPPPSRPRRRGSPSRRRSNGRASSSPLRPRPGQGAEAVEQGVQERRHLVHRAGEARAGARPAAISAAPRAERRAAGRPRAGRP